MAEMIPDRLPHKASQGEKRLFHILQSLPDDCLVYYEPLVRDRYPDFVAILPDHGLLVIEVKGWYPTNIAGGDHNKVQVNERGLEQSYKSPVLQARDYMFGLMDQCKQHPEYKELLNPDGEHQNRFVFPFGYFSVLSNITSEQLQQHTLGNLEEIFPEKRVVSRDQLLSWEDLGEQELLESLRSFFDPTWPFPKLTEQQIDVLRSIIHPEILIAPPPSEAPKEDIEPTVQSLKVLDLRQEKNSRNIGDGHRIIYGVAGSGKTVLLVSRAKLLHQEDEDARILVLCFNVSLASYLRHCLSDCKRIDVHHFHGWARNNGVKWKKDETNDELGARFLERMTQGYGDASTYDAVLIDEAQDFDSSWFACALEAMKEKLDGDLLIVGDGSQGLYRRSPISWKSIGINAVGRTVSKRFDLDKNYRNTREILELAALFASESSASEEDTVLSVKVDPGKTLRFNGHPPLLIESPDRATESRNVIALVRELLNGKWGSQTLSEALRPSDIAILYPMLRKHLRNTFDNFRDELAELGPLVWVNDPQDKTARTRIAEPGFKLQTIHSAKGLQYKCVIILWADLLPSDFTDSDLEEDRRKFYVALTRAEEYLAISSAGDSQFIRDIRRSDNVTFWPTH